MLGCRALAKKYGGQLNRAQIVEVLHGAGVGEGGELAELLWTEMGLSEDAHITQVAPLFIHMLQEPFQPAFSSTSPSTISRRHEHHATHNVPASCPSYPKERGDGMHPNASLSLNLHSYSDS